MSMRLRHLFFIAAASALLSFSASSQERPPRVALVIGNASYPDAGSPLSTTISDARAMADEFRGNNFDVDLKENVGNEDMRRAVEAFLNKIRTGASALLYFNGIGIQVGRQTYLIPVNAQISSEAGVRRDGISVDATLAEMHRRGAKVKIVILEAARRNPFETRFRTSAAGLAAIDAPEGTIAIYSAAPGKVIADGAGANSLFTAELIKELRVPNRTTEEVFNRTRISVSRASKNEQVPWVATSLVDQFYLAPGRPEATSAAPPAPPPDPDAQARRDYQLAEQTGTKKAWDDFVARYPSGRYADLARDQLAKLAAPPARPKPAETAAKPAPPPVAAPPTPAPAAPAPPVAPSPTAVAPPAPAPVAPAPPVASSPPVASPPPVALSPPVQPAPTQPAPPGSDDPAIRELNERIKANPNDTAAYYKRGQLYAQHGAHRRAIEDFDAAIRLNPKDAEALNNRCWTRAVVGDLQSALKDCDEALQIRPRYLDAFDSRGFVNLKMSKPRNAITDYDAALQINPRHASALYGRGLAKIQTGNTSGGNSDIAAAKRIQPDIVDEFASYGVR